MWWLVRHYLIFLLWSVNYSLCLPCMKLKPNFISYAKQVCMRLCCRGYVLWCPEMFQTTVQRLVEVEPLGKKIGKLWKVQISFKIYMVYDYKD